MIRLKWLPLFITNFLSVINDNLLKYLITYIAVLWLNKGQSDLVITLAAGMLIIPFVLLSPLAGKLAMVNLKSDIIKRTKLMEIPIMIIASLGFWLENEYLVFTALFFMGVQSCLLSPSKYGIIRDIGGKQGITFGTGVMEMITFLAILLGTYYGGYLSDLDKNQLLCIIVITISIALLGWITSLFIKANESAPITKYEGTINPIKFFNESYNYAKSIQGLNYVIFCLASFWLIGSLILMNIVKHGKEILIITNTETSVISAFMAIAIAVGCILAGVVSKRRIPIGLIPIGGLGLSISFLLIVIMRPDIKLFTILMMVATYFGGLYKVPLNSWIQDRVAGRRLGEMIAYLNFCAFALMLVSSGFFYLITSFSGSYMVFLAIAIISIIITIVATFKIPRVYNRFMLYALVFVFSRRTLLRRLRIIQQINKS